jgi:3-oxoacyl-[acyl-carrier-protein] synthase II
MESARRRVVVTGLGVISPLGLSPEALWNALQEGRSGVVAYAPEFQKPLPIGYAAPAKDFEGKIDNFGPLEKTTKKAIRKGLKLMSREIQMGVAAAQHALTDSRLDLDSIDRRRIGVSFGSDYILTTPEELIDGIKACREKGGFDFACWPREGMGHMNPLWQLKFLPNMPASHIAIYNQLFGPNNSITLREASIGAVVGESVHAIRQGKADLMLVGATGSRLQPFKLIHAVQKEEVARASVSPEEASRPFDKNRHGMVLGEGAGSLILESAEHALARGATIYGEVLSGSYIASCRLSSGCLIQGECREAIAQALANVLHQGEIHAEAIGHFNAHGLATYAGDIEEAKGIQAALGPRSSALPLVAAKSFFGNLGAGSGAVELVASILALANNRLFPVLNFRTGDPECPVAVVREADQPAGEAFVKLAWNPQGQASAILMRRFEAP